MASLGESVENRIAFVRRIEDLVGPMAGRAVLDLGCGRHAYWTRAYVARGAVVVATDLDPVRCREARGRLSSEPPHGDGRVVGVTRSNGQYLPLRAQSVAFVHCAQVLEHVASPEQFLRELRRVLVPGGSCYLTAINRFAWRDPHFNVAGVNYLPRGFADQVLRAIGAVNGEGQTLSEMHYYSRGGFARLCAATGFEVTCDLKRRERFAKQGPVGGRIADAWGAIRSAAFHMVLRRPATDAAGR